MPFKKHSWAKRNPFSPFSTPRQIEGVEQSRLGAQGHDQLPVAPQQRLRPDWEPENAR